MTITTTEFVLFCWGIVMTLLWMQARANLDFHKKMTVELMRRIAKNKIKVIEQDGHFDFREV